MNLIIDIGNTRIKTACFQDDNLIWQKSYSSVSEINKTSLKDFKNVIISSVAEQTKTEIIQKEVNNAIVLNENTKTLAFLYYNQNKLNLYFLEGKFTQGLPFVVKLVNKLEAYENQIDEHHIMVFYYKIACMYFGAGKNEDCIVYLEKIINNKELKMREDLLCYARVLNLVAHYEAGIDSNIEKLIVSTYKFLLKMNDLHQVQRKMIEFLKNLSNIYPQDLKKEFIKLHIELKKYENHPFERRAFLYLDILSWLESKIHNVSVESIIQTKAKKLLK